MQRTELLVADSLADFSATRQPRRFNFRALTGFLKGTLLVVACAMALCIGLLWGTGIRILLGW